MKYLRNLYPKRVDLWKMTKDLLEAADKLTFHVSAVGFAKTDIQLFENFADEAMKVTQRMVQYNMPESDYVVRVCGETGEKTTSYPDYWLTFVDSTGEMSHMAHLLLEIKRGKLDGYMDEIRKFGASMPQPFLPLSVYGQRFALEYGQIPAKWVKSMLYIEMQFNIMGHAELAKQLWRQAFPHGENVKDIYMHRDHEDLYDEERISWVDLEAEAIVSKSYPPVSNYMKVRFPDNPELVIEREKVCPVPQETKYFLWNYPRIVQPYFGNKEPYDFKPQTNWGVVRVAWLWIKVYEILNGPVGASNYLVIPHEVSLKDFSTKCFKGGEEKRIQVIRKDVGDGEKAHPCAYAENIGSQEESHNNLDGEYE